MSRSDSAKIACSSTKIWRRMVKWSASSAAEATWRHTTWEAVGRGREPTDGNPAAGMLSSAGMGQLHRTRADLQERSDTRLSGAGLATRTARLRRVALHATFGHVSAHLSVDALGVGAVRRFDVLHQAASHWTDGHHEGEDTDVDRSTTSLYGQLRVLSHAQDDVRRDLPLAEAVNRPLPGAEVRLDARTGLGRCDVGQDGWVERLDVDADRVDSEVGHLIDDFELPRRLELNFHRQTGRLLDRMSASGDVPGAAVDPVGAPRRQCRVDGAVELLGCRGHLGQLLRALLDDGSTRVQGDTDPTELALIIVAPVRAGLNDGAGERVEVQQADFPVRDAVSSGEIVEARALLGRRSSQPLTALEDRVSVVLGFEGVRRASGRGIVSRDRDRETADPEHAGVRGPGAAVATLERHFDPEATSLQVDHQACQRARGIDALCCL